MRPILATMLVFLVSAVPAAAQPVLVPAEAEEDGQQDGEEAPAADELVFYGEAVGEYRLRANYMSDIPLAPELPGSPGTQPEELGQNFWVGQWLRLAIELGLRDRLRIVGEADVFDGLVVGQFTEGVDVAERPRAEASAFPGAEPRALYAEWTPDWGKAQAGLTPVHWGLGILQNDGDHEPPFGDYDHGDTALRLAVVTQPFGDDAPLFAGIAGDLVYHDQLAHLPDGQEAWRGELVLAYRDGRQRAGLLATYRTQSDDREDDRGRDLGGVLTRVVLDLYAHLEGEWDETGRLFFEAEAALGRTQTEGLIPTPEPPPGEDIPRPPPYLFESDRYDLRVVGRMGRRSGHVDVVLEGGYASGWSTESQLGRATLHPDHQVGLIMFPEVVAWQNARSLTLFRDARGPIPSGDIFEPTQGGVAAAFYLYPVVTWRLFEWLRARFGAVWGHASSDVNDPTRGLGFNYRGGDAGNRDLGLELDAQIHAEGELNRGIVLSGGVEGGYFLPGHAFDDPEGRTMAPVGLLRARLGLTF